MKTFIAVFVALNLSFESAIAGLSDSWINKMPTESWPGGNIPRLAEKNLIEIQSSKLRSAEERLTGTAISELRESYELLQFAPRGFSCPSGERAYLVRALYEYGERNHWEVLMIGPDIIVRGSALGPHAQAHRSALVLCLKKRPRNIYVEVHGAM